MLTFIRKNILTNSEQRVFRLLLCCAFVLPAWSGISSPRAVAQAADSVPSSLQLYVRLESWDRQLQPLDETSLEPVENPSAIQLGSPGGYQPSTILTSNDGAIVAAVSVKPMTGGMTEAQYRKAMSVRVVDVRTGLKRALFHPAVPVWIQGISSDGSQLFGWRMSADTGQKPEWDVLSSSDGKVVGSLTPDVGCCSQTLYDPVQGRLYGLDLPSGGTSGAKSATPVLVSYDLQSSGTSSRLRLDGIQTSTIVPPQSGNTPVFTMWKPGFALSPDGSRIAVLDGESNRLELIDARQMTIVRTVDLVRRQSLLERLGDALGLLPATASAKEWLGVDLSITFSPDGRRLYVTGRQGKIGSDGKWTVDGLGLRLVDIASGQILADALAGQWVSRVMPNPDGSTIYTESDPPMGGSPTVLQREDAATLAVSAQRNFYDGPELYFLTKASPPAPSWLQAWPMTGHDPRRSNRSPASGPVEPHLLFEQKGLYPQLAGPDGSIYAASAYGLVALDAAGKQRWTAGECCGEGPPALAPNGMLLGTGFRRGPPAGQEDTEAIGLGQDGTVTWRIQPFGVLKGAVPLVDAANLLYLPIAGPEGANAQGLNIMSADGTMLRKLPRTYNLAVAPDGTIFALTGGGLAAFSPDGTVLWRHRLSFQPSGIAGPLVGQNGTVYVGDGNRVDAFTPAGTLLWHRTKVDAEFTLAERSDGVLLVAGRNTLDAFQPNGTHLWQTPIGVSRGQYAAERPSLIVDGDGTAYAASGDGLVRVVSVDGELVGACDGGGQHHHVTPGLLLDAGGRLIVSGTDGNLRVYGS
jgi:outer membrane protein assembly factor BamB